MASTLLLDRSKWDLVLDVNGNMAVATEPYSQAQDVASAVRTFSGEVYYDSALGVPYFNPLFGIPPLSLVKAKLIDAALTVPGVTAARVYITGLANRLLRGQIHVTNADGANLPVNF